MAKTCSICGEDNGPRKRCVECRSLACVKCRAGRMCTMCDALRPGPGVHRNIPSTDYHRWPYINNSSLRAAVKSGQHYKIAQGTQNGATREMDLGSVVHCLAFDRGAFHTEFAIEPDYTEEVLWNYRDPTRSSEYKGLQAKWRAEHKHQTIVDQATYDQAVACLSSVSSAIGSWIDAGETEVSLVADCPETGLRLKSRLDLLMPDRIVDLKTTRAGDDFEREIVNFHYARQAAFYQDMVYACLGVRLPVWFVAVEKSEPYLVRAAPMAEEDIDEGRREMMIALRRIAAGQETGKWAGYDAPLRWRTTGRSVVDLMVQGKHVVIGG